MPKLLSLKTGAKIDISLVMCPIWNIYEPPLSISYLSSALRDSGFNVRCHDFSVALIDAIPERHKAMVMQTYLPSGWYEDFDFWKRELGLETLIEHWVDKILEDEPMVVGFSTYLSNISVTQLLAKQIHKRSTDTCLVFGGPCCDQTPLFNDGTVDILVHGEGEVTACELMQWLKDRVTLEGCAGISYRDNSGPVRTAARPMIADINQIPIPDFNDYELQNYPNRCLPMLTSRGCYNRCTFCADSPQWGRYRFRTAENIVDEMERNVRVYGIQHFNLADWLINGNIKEFERMCDLILARSLQVGWTGKACAHRAMDPKLMRIVHAAGCRQLIFGVESGSQRVLDHMRKNAQLEVVEEVLRNTKNAGISVGCFLIAGYVNETEQDFEETLQFITRNHGFIDAVYPGEGCMVLKGSALYERHDEFGIVLPEWGFEHDWYTVDGSNTRQLRISRAGRLKAHLESIYPKQKGGIF